MFGLRRLSFILRAFDSDVSGWTVIIVVESFSELSMTTIL